MADPRFVRDHPTVEVLWNSYIRIGVGHERVGRVVSWLGFLAATLGGFATPWFWMGAALLAFTMVLVGSSRTQRLWSEAQRPRLVMVPAGIAQLSRVINRRRLIDPVTMEFVKEQVEEDIGEDRPYGAFLSVQNLSDTHAEAASVTNAVIEVTARSRATGAVVWHTPKGYWSDNHEPHASAHTKTLDQLARRDLRANGEKHIIQVAQLHKDGSVLGIDAFISTGNLTDQTLAGYFWGGGPSWTVTVRVTGENTAPQEGVFVLAALEGSALSFTDHGQGQ